MLGALKQEPPGREGTRPRPEAGSPGPALLLEALFPFVRCVGSSPEFPKGQPELQMGWSTAICGRQVVACPRSSPSGRGPSWEGVCVCVCGAGVIGQVRPEKLGSLVGKLLPT